MQARNAFQYTAREVDIETGLQYNRARYYDPSDGRFLSEDPIGFEGGINKYTYSLNNPIVFNDPTGLDTVVIFVWDNPINHSGVYVDNGGKQNDSGPVIYDPGGDFSTTHRCGSGDLCYGYSIDDYVNYYQRQGFKVDVLRFPTTPEEEARIGDRMAEHGGSPGTCAITVRRVLEGIGPFEKLGNPITPGQLRDHSCPNCESEN
jgi:RHS repeat-associated core domain